MHALNIVQQLIRSCCPHIHAARLEVILAAVAHFDAYRWALPDIV